jgi:hypothetical protein
LLRLVVFTLLSLLLVIPREPRISIVSRWYDHRQALFEGHSATTAMAEHEFEYAMSVVNAK